MKFEIKGTPLIKFQNKDKLEKMMQGKIYFKSLEYYREREQQKGDDTVGDLFEAMIHVNDCCVIVPELNLCEQLSDSFIKTSFSNSFVFCLFSLSEDEKSFVFSDEQKEKILGFGNSALIITDRNEFLYRVAVALEREKIKGYHDFVNYYDETVDSANYWLSIVKNGLNHVAFYKRKRYAYQKEYRFMIEPPHSNNDFYELEIGDISDIAVIVSAKQALNAIAQAIT